MEFNSLHVKESKLNQENKFTFDFVANEEEIKRVIFTPSKDYYITTLNANIKLDEDKEALKKRVKQSDAWDSILKLSKLSNKLAKKGASYQNDIKAVLFKVSKVGLAPQSEKLDIILNDEIIDAMSYNYRYYDVEEYKFKEGKIYDPYRHFRGLGLSFKQNNYEKIFRVKLSLKNDEIAQSLYLDRNLFDFDTFYLAQNQFFVLEQPSQKYIGSYSYYHRAVNYYYHANGKRISSSNDVIKAYYQGSYNLKL